MEILKHLHVIHWPRRTYIERQITYLQNPNGLPFLVLKHYQHLQVSTNIPLTTESLSLPCNQPKLSTSKPVKRSKLMNTVIMCFNSSPSIPPVALLSWLLKTVPRLSSFFSLSFTISPPNPTDFRVTNATTGSSRNLIREIDHFVKWNGVRFGTCYRNFFGNCICLWMEPNDGA